MERDNTPITAGSFVRPKNVAVAIVFYVFLVLFKVCLVSMIRINAALIGNFGFHCKAVELLYEISALLGFKSYR